MVQAIRKTRSISLPWTRWLIYTLTVDPLNRTGQVFTTDGRELPSTISYWFAWQAFHPDSEVYTAPAVRKPTTGGKIR
jgi:hypothetical protein